MPQTRQLAAIMFTDIVGYTALMGKDEQKAFQLLEKNRQIQRPIIEQFNGRWIKELGDGVMASFTAVSDAIHAAVKIQQTCNSSGTFQLRIGIHLGEVVFENNDVFGDGVNIASRIQALAPPGSIWISESVHNSISNKTEFRSKFFTEQRLKNVKEPVKVYQVVADGVAVAHQQIAQKIKHKRNAILYAVAIITILAIAYFLKWGFTSTKNDSFAGVDSTIAKSIAVLSFVNMSGDKEQEYFSDGMSEELLNLLSKIPDIKVISRTSSFSFKGKNQDVRIIGNTLGAAYILEGSVRKSENMIRITAQLIEAKNGTHLWSETFDRQIKDVFAIQDEISKMIVSSLKIKLLDEQASRMVKRNTENPDAFEDYLKGRYYWNQRTEEGFKKAISYFESAIRKDPNYAAAYSGLADTYLTLYDYGLMSIDESTSKAKGAAQRALRINENLAEAHNSLAHIDLHEWKWETAEKGFRRAITLDPGYILAHHWYALCLTAIGKTNEAVTQMEKARELDPLSTRINADLGMAYLSAGRYDEAISQEQKTLELNPRSAGARWIRGMAYQQKKMFDSAIKDYQSALELSPNNPNFLAALGHVYASSGKSLEAHKILDTLFVVNKQEPVSPFFFALVYAGLTDKEKALEWLEKSYEEKSGSVRYLKMEPRLQNLRNEPRYTVLMKKIGLEK